MNNLPAFLQNRKSQAVGARAIAGLGSLLPPHISIRANNFTLIDATGNKQEVPTKYLDVCIADISDVMCKNYYENAYEPGSNEPPTCFSMNGVAPSRDASNPQSATCASCQWNVRGSEVSAISGKPIKACRDEKQMAVIVPEYPQMLFRLTLTPGSFKNWRQYQEKFTGQDIDVSDVVTRLAFQRDTNGVLTFEGTAYITEAIFAVREQALSAKATDLLVGRNDVPISGALPAPAAPAAISNQAPAGAPLVATSPFGMPATQPAPIAPLAPNPAPSFGTAPPVAAEPAAPQRRRRRTKAEMEADKAAANGQSPAPAQAPFRPAAPPQQAPFAAQPAQGTPAPFAPAAPPQQGQGTFGITGSVPPDPAITAAIDGIFGKPQQ